MIESSYRVVLLLRRDLRLSPEDFALAWTGSEALPALPHLQGRTFSVPASAAVPIQNVSAPAYDGVEELRFASREHAATALADPAMRRWVSQRSGLLRAAAEVVSGTTVLVWQRKADQSRAVKIFTLPIRRAGMTFAAFRSHWIDRHAGLALDGPGTRERLLQLASTPADRVSWDMCVTAPFDGIGVIQFDSPESMAAEFASEHYRNVMAPDEPLFTDAAKSAALIVEQVVHRDFR